METDFWNRLAEALQKKGYSVCTNCAGNEQPVQGTKAVFVPYHDDEIRQANALLSDYYSFLETLVPEATAIRPSENPLWFTDSKFEYGAIPSHYNELLNQHLAESIELQLTHLTPRNQ